VPLAFLYYFSMMWDQALCCGPHNAPPDLHLCNHFCAKAEAKRFGSGLSAHRCGRLLQAPSDLSGGQTGPGKAAAQAFSRPRPSSP